MRYEIRYLPLACLDLDGIAEYLRCFYPDTASRVLHSIEEKLKALEQMPEMYEEYPKNPFYRRMVVEKYLVFYHVNREGSLHRLAAQPVCADPPQNRGVPDRKSTRLNSSHQD